MKKSDTLKFKTNRRKGIVFKRQSGKRKETE